MPPNSLDFVSKAAALLEEHGNAQLQYITAEFEPFSSAQRPDLIFIPHAGVNCGRIFVTECRVHPSRFELDPLLMEEHRNFVLEDMNGYHFFALATHAAVTAEMRAALAIRGVEVLDNVETPHALAEAVLAWSRAAETPPWSANA
jgi:hypothetical protein